MFCHYWCTVPVLLLSCTLHRLHQTHRLLVCVSSTNSWLSEVREIIMELKGHFTSNDRQTEEEPGKQDVHSMHQTFILG